LLARHFVQRLGQEQGRAAVQFDDAAWALLRGYPWPGNVRELRNAIESALLLSGDSTTLKVEFLPQELTHAGARLAPLGAADANTGIASIPDGEQLLIRQAIDACGGNLTAAARRLQIAKSTLYAKMKRYGLSRHDAAG
jgi:DNA-binding NtrC family response regulator